MFVSTSKAKEFAFAVVPKTLFVRPHPVQKNAKPSQILSFFWCLAVLALPPFLQPPLLAASFSASKAPQVHTK